MTTAYGLSSSRDTLMVSATAFRSNTVGRDGMTTSVAARMASVTTGDLVGGVSTRTHSEPSRFAALTMSAMPRLAVLSIGSPVPRIACQSVSDPCGSESMSRQDREDLLAQ